MTTQTTLPQVDALVGVRDRRTPTNGGGSPARTARRVAGRVVLYAVLLIGAAASLLPLLWMVSTSFKSDSEVFAVPLTWIPRSFTPRYYVEALFSTSPNFVNFFANTMLLEFLCIVGTVITSTLGAYAFSRVQWPGRDKVFAAVLATMMIPFAVTIVPLFIGWSQVGAVNTYVPLALPFWFGGGAFNIFLLRQFMMQIPRDFDEAAMIDGAGHWYIITRIIAPMIRPAILVVTIFTFIGVWNDFFGPLIYLTSNEKYTLALGLTSFRSTYDTAWNLLMAASVATIIPVVVVLFVFQKPIIEGADLNPGVKG